MKKAVSKASIIRRVSEELDISEEEVSHVISLFIDEFIRILQTGKKMVIANFCQFSLENTEPRKYHDIRYKKVLLSKEKKVLKIRLPKKLRKFVRRNLDIYKTFL